METSGNPACPVTSSLVCREGLEEARVTRFAAAQTDLGMQCPEAATLSSMSRPLQSTALRLRKQGHAASLSAPDGSIQFTDLPPPPPEGGQQM